MKKFIKRHEKLARLSKRLPRGELSSLADILYYVKRKFRVKDANDLRFIQLIGVWRLNYDCLRGQYNYCLDFIYYLIIQVPKPKFK